MKILLPLFILALPILEIAGFIIVGSAIGILPTIGLLLLGVILGLYIVRRQGFTHITQMKAQMDAGEPPVADMLHTVLILVAGFCILLPGFITDAIGLLLLVPPLRALVALFLVRNLRPVRPAGPTIIDGEYEVHEPDDRPYATGPVIDYKPEDNDPKA